MIELILADYFREQLKEQLRPKILYIMQTFLSCIELKATQSHHRIKVRIVYGSHNPHSPFLDDIPTVFLPASLVGLEDMCKTGAWPTPELIQLRGNPVKIPYMVNDQKREEDIDLIASIFFFLSLQHEISLYLTGYDELCLPYQKTWFAKYNFWPKIPIVSLLFQCLVDRINCVLGNDFLSLRLFYPDGKKFAIGLSHDVDFIPYGYWSSLKRAAKNAAILALLNKNPLLSGKVLTNFIYCLLRRHRPFNNIPTLLRKEADAKIKSSFELFSKQSPHPKDPNYDIDDKPIQAVIKSIVESGHEINLHGSFTSCTQEGKLDKEARSLRRYVRSVNGNRQHYLNLTVPMLHIELEKAEIKYDMSLAYPEVIGYRTGLDRPHFLWNTNVLFQTDQEKKGVSN